MLESLAGPEIVRKLWPFKPLLLIAKTLKEGGIEKKAFCIPNAAFRASEERDSFSHIFKRTN